MNKPRCKEPRTRADKPEISLLRRLLRAGLVSLACCSSLLACGAPDPDSGEEAKGIRLTDILINQGVQSELVIDGEFVAAEQRTAVVIGGRGGVIQAFWELDADFEPRDIEARLSIYHPDGEIAVHRATRTISGPPGGQGALDSAFSWILSGDDLPGDAQFSVGLFEASGDHAGVNRGHRFPTEGAQDLLVNGDDITFDLVFVLSADCPTTFQWSDDVKNQITSYAYNLFPVSNINVSFRDPTPGVGCDPYDPDGVQALRDQEALGPSYYYQLVLDEEQSECGGGYAWFAGSGMDGLRVSSMGAFCWEMDFSNSPHELGHNFDREHPWNDANYPGNGDVGEIFDWGFGVRGGVVPGPDGNFEVEDQFIDPEQFFDMVAYDYPRWVSAYHYNAIFEIIDIVSSWSDPSTASPRQFASYYENRSLRGTVDELGTWRWSMAFGVPTLTGERGAEILAHYAEVRSQSQRSSFGRIEVKPLYARASRSSGHEHHEMRGVLVPLPEDYRALGVDSVTVVIDGQTHEVALDSVTDNLPKNVDWRVKLAEHQARRAVARAGDGG